MSGLSCGSYRWPSWVFASVSGTNLRGVLGAHVFFPVLPELGIWTAAFPITLFSASCRISRTCVRRLPSRARTSRRSACCGGDTPFGVVDLFARHQRPCDTRHLVRQSHSHEPERTAFKYRSGPDPSRAIPLRSSVPHRRGAQNKQPAYLP